VNPYQAVLFDLGDTLVDFEPLDTRELFRLSAQRSYDHLLSAGAKLPDFESFFRSQYRDLRWSYLWAKLRRKEFNSIHLLRRLCRKINHPLDEQGLYELAWLWYSPLCDFASVEAGLTEALDRLQKGGVRMGIVSNTFVPGKILDRHLKEVGLLDYFPVRVYSSEVGFRKPNRRIFELALQQLDVRPEQSLFVGDLLKTDMVGARRVGMTTVLKSPFAGSRPNPLAHHTIRAMSELPAIVLGNQTN
jgi:putative hydrolase of the HAD superfamily